MASLTGAQSETPEDCDSRTLISVIGRSFVPNGHTVSLYITRIFREKQCKEGHIWKKVNKETKTFYWGEFMKNYTWLPEEGEKIKAVWKFNCGQLYKKTLCNWRRLAWAPIGVNPEVWAAWMVVWSNPAWKKKSDIAQKNRNSELAGPGTGLSKHTGGSQSFVEHTIRMKKDLGRDISAWELFRKTHIQKDGYFVDARSKALDDDMSAMVAQASRPDVEGGELVTPTVNEINDMYIHVAGGVKKNNLYGLGSQAVVIYPDVMSECGIRSRGTSISTAAIAEATAAAEAASAKAASAIAKCEELASEAAVSNAKVEELTQDNMTLRNQLYSLEKQINILMANMNFQLQDTSQDDEYPHPFSVLDFY